MSVDRPSHEGRWPREPNTYVTDTDGPGWNTEIAWSSETRGGPSPTMPVVADGSVYHLDSRTANHEHSGGTWLAEFDAGNGEKRWETRLWETDEYYYFYHLGPPVLDGDRLFAQTHGGVKAISTDGEILWTFRNFGTGHLAPDSTPPIVTDELVVVGSYGTWRKAVPEQLYALDRESGDVVWSHEFGMNDHFWQLTRNGDTFFAPLSAENSRLLELDISTGETIRQYSVSPVSSVTLTENLVITPVRRGPRTFALVAFARDTTEIQWQNDADVFEAEIVVNGDRFYHSHVGELTARRTDTGEVLWQVGGPSEDIVINADSTPVIAGDSLYIAASRFLGERKGYGRIILVLDPETGSERGHLVPWPDTNSWFSTPAIVDGAMYLDSRHGLVCLEDCAADAFGHCLLG
ncbi:Pyrrolo-quinoline quinone [Haloferax mediterranei ATCC 33500]|uniref:Pyrrolo-quinoline quinone n=1 Tax=Haloferax mediterranei (strain ATCC 33500 / DSM 1411 / JCM 8866 / NBRC 14739 / NCIMB 2177 / R-4) TaxID=523841 RepID=A0A4P8P6H8_HALMT|nr:Pyrrolo-quinoline quinone [Haloferax mediterranei ATCC 33500]